MNIFEIFSVFDWVNPLTEIAKDTHYAFTDGEDKTTIWVKSEDYKWALKKLKGEGIIISKDPPLGGEAGFDVKNRNVSKAREILSNNGVDSW